MPGAYAHLTVVNHARESARLKAAGVSSEAAIAVMRHFKYVELGTVSPDLPYLALDFVQMPPGLDAGASRWADLMHYESTGAVLGEGVRLLTEQTVPAKLIAWLWGYAAHVITDLTIHPVVELKVGPYHANRRAHRICEMHQDAYIYQRLDLGVIGDAEHLDSGIRACTDEEGALDKDISAFWTTILEAVHPLAFDTDRPDPARWHAGFSALLDRVEESTRLFPWARHVGAHTGLSYPLPSEVAEEFIGNLTVPGGSTQHYDTIFDKAVDNVVRCWAQMSDALERADAPFFAQLGAWNLDTGKDTETGEFVLWKV